MESNRKQSPRLIVFIFLLGVAQSIENDQDFGGYRIQDGQETVNTYLYTSGSLSSSDLSVTTLYTGSLQLTDRD